MIITESMEEPLCDCSLRSLNSGSCRTTKRLLSSKHVWHDSVKRILKTCYQVHNHLLRTNATDDIVVEMGIKMARSLKVWICRNYKLQLIFLLKTLGCPHGTTSLSSKESLMKSYRNPLGTVLQSYWINHKTVPMQNLTYYATSSKMCKQQHTIGNSLTRSRTTGPSRMNVIAIFVKVQ